MKVVDKVSDYLKIELKAEQSRFADRQKRLKKVGAI